MTSNGDSAVLNALPTATTDVDSAARSRPPFSPRPAASPRQPKPCSPPSALGRRSSNPRLHNGDNGDDDGEHESEAETVVLGDVNEDHARQKVIKTERTDDDESRLRYIKEASRARSPAINGRRGSVAEARVNGAKHGSDRDPRSPVPTSPSSRTTSRHPKDASPDSAKSPVQSTTSPTQTTTRGRSSSTVESRKRKLRDESNSKIGPPRQKAKTEGLKDPRNQPTSPTTPGLGRPHKRSQSTQSALQGGAGRKRRELTSIALPLQERKNWSDSSSENSSSPRPVQTPDLPHTRVKRSSHRALTSPARAMPHKKNVDRFGATRLARESEKGDLSQVKAAYIAAPEELDQSDFAGIAPLQKASLHGWLDVVGFLISKGCRTDCESNDRDTPLIDAVENGHLDVVKLLLDKGHVNPHHQNKKGQRAIDVLDHEDSDAEEIEKELRAAMRRETDTTRDDSNQSGLSQQKSASRLLYNEYNTETLVEKAGDGDILAVGELINSNIKPNIACGVAAARGGHYDILSILLASGLKADPDPSKHSETPMLVAIGRGHIKIVHLLLEQDNFNPSRRNRDGKAYYEISEERRGPKWEQEREVLKTAHDTWLQTHKSPKRTKKEPPNASGAVRMKRKSSPLRRDRSSSPRPEPKRQSAKSISEARPPPKARRLMSGKEMANQAAAKRRRRVVNDESSEEESEDDVRPPKKVITKPRSYSEGEDHKAKKVPKVRAQEHEHQKRSARARSEESDDDHHRKPKKMAVKSEKSQSKPTPDLESPDERKPVKKLIKNRSMEEVSKIKKRRLSEASTDDRPRKTPTASAKSTPAPPEKAGTPEAVRERRQEEQRQAAEAKRKAAEAEAKRKEEEEAAREAARKAAEEEEARKKAEAEAEAQAEAIRKAEAEALEAKRKAEEAEKARIAAEEEAKRQAEEEARQAKARRARQKRISKLPKAIRRACELGTDRPLHFAGEELGISAVFLPLFYATSEDLERNEPDGESKSYIMSFQAVGILGLPEADLAELDEPYSDWQRLPVTLKQRESLLRQYDIALLAQDLRFPMEGSPEFDYTVIQGAIKEARQQFLDMNGLYWIEDQVLYPEVEKVESLAPLVPEIKDIQKRRHLVLEPESEDEDADDAPERRPKPKKSFLDVLLGQANLNGDRTDSVNGEG